MPRTRYPDPLPNEQWRPVLGWEDAYLVSSEGRVWCKLRRVPCRGGKTRLVGGNLVRHTYDDNGYAQVTLSANSRRAVLKVHRLVLEAFVGPRPEGMEACHEDGHRGNPCLDNLRWDTHASNIADKRVHGTEPQGEQRHQSKLRADQVREIRALAGTMSQEAIGERFGVRQSTVSTITRGKSWTHLEVA